MRVLVVSEGEHEQGGALANLLRKLGGQEAEFVCDCVRRDDIHTHSGKGTGYTKRALRWLKEARKREMDALVLLVDQDNPEYRRDEQLRHRSTRIRRCPRSLCLVPWGLRSRRLMRGCWRTRRPWQRFWDAPFRNNVILKLSAGPRRSVRSCSMKV